MRRACSSVASNSVRGRSAANREAAVEARNKRRFMFLSLSTTLAMVVTSPMHAFIAGASGLIGGECLKLLLERYSSVTALVRRPLGGTHERRTELPVDLDGLSSIHSPPGPHVLSALGTTIRKAGSKPPFHKGQYEYLAALLFT